MKKREYELRRCIICGKEFMPKRCDQKTCLDDECKKAVVRQGQIAYRKRNYNKVLADNRRSMKERKEKKRYMEQSKPDTIIGEGYAERQIQSTLRMVGKIDPQL